MKKLIAILLVLCIISAVSLGVYADIVPISAEIYEYTDSFSTIGELTLSAAGNPLTYTTLENPAMMTPSSSVKNMSELPSGIANAAEYVIADDGEYKWTGYYKVDSAPTKYTTYYEPTNSATGKPAVKMYVGSSGGGSKNSAVLEKAEGDFSDSIISGISFSVPVSRIAHDRRVYMFEDTKRKYNSTNIDSKGIVFGIAKAGVKPGEGVTLIDAAGNEATSTTSTQIDNRPYIMINGKYIEIWNIAFGNTWETFEEDGCLDCAFTVDGNKLSWEITARNMQTATNTRYYDMETVWSGSYENEAIGTAVNSCKYPIMLTCHPQYGQSDFNNDSGITNKENEDGKAQYGFAVSDININAVTGVSPSVVAEEGSNDASLLVKPSFYGKEVPFKIVCANYDSTGVLTYKKAFDITEPASSILNKLTFTKNTDPAGKTRVIALGGISYSLLGEPDDVLYYDIKNKINSNTVTLTGSMPVRRIKAPSLANASDVSISLSKDNTLWTQYDADFDANGLWLNSLTDESAGYVRFDDGIPTDLQILGACENNGTINLPVSGTNALISRFGGVDADNAVWSAVDSQYATVTNGVVRAVKPGDTTVTAVLGDDSFTVNIHIMDELEYAEANDAVDEFIESKRPIINALNDAIESNSRNDVKTVISGSGALTLEAMPCIDRGLIINKYTSDPTGFDSYADRIISYGKFDYIDKQDILDIENTLISELATGDLNNVSDTAVIEGVLTVNSNVFGTDLTNNYYTENKADVLSKMTDMVYTNIKAVNTVFKDAVAYTAFKAADTYTAIGSIVADLDTYIGYNQATFNAVANKTDLYMYLKTKQAEIDSNTELKQYIEAYNPNWNQTQNPGSLGGGGGGGGGAGGSITIPPKEPVAPPTNGAIVAPQQSIYDDVPTQHWAYEPIRYLTAKSAASGDGNGNFAPDRNVTRAEFIKMLLLAFDIEVYQPQEKDTQEEGAEAEEEEPFFADVAENSWYYNYIVTAKELGILSGDGINAFPDRQISRQEAAAFVYRTLKINEIELVNTAKPVVFTDSDKIAEWAFPAVAKLQLADVINGTPQGSFEPDSSATRAETAKIIYKASTAERKVVEEVTEEVVADE